MSGIEVLLKENNDLTSKMWRLHKELDEVKQLIKQNERALFKTCDHKWVYDTSCGPYESIKYQCKICNCWRNRYMYL